MFTGIVEEVGTVRRVGGGTLSIDAEEILTDVRLGDSIAVNGVCLTVTSFDKNHFEADVMPETVRRGDVPFSPLGVLRDFRNVFRNRIFLLGAATLSLSYIPLMSWVAVSPVMSRIALDSVSTPVSAGGIELCPPGALAVTFSVP